MQTWYLFCLAKQVVPFFIHTRMISFKFSWYLELQKMAASPNLVTWRTARGELILTDLFSLYLGQGVMAD